MDVTQFAFSVEDFLAPFTGETEGFWEGAEELDDLRDVVVVFTVFCAGLRVEEVVAGYEFEDLLLQLVEKFRELGKGEGLTMAAILHTSVLAPHFAPNITSGDLYCRV